MIDFKRVPSPCFLLDERLLARNLSVVDRVRRESGAEVIVALKACAMWSIFPLLARHSDGATASSAAEARLVREEFGQPAHTYAPVYTDRNIGEILDCSSHITFNSLGQFRRFGAMALLRGISCGLRVNPRYSPVETDLYNPCVAGSRLGVTAEELEAQGGLPDGIEGLHFHSLCESDSHALAKVLDAFEQQFGKYLRQVKWVNMGGGHLMTREGYDVNHLIQLLKDFKSRYPWLEVIMEPGSAFTWQTGDLVTSVVDVVENQGVKTAIIDASFACHMPDCLEMPYQPAIAESCEEATDTIAYRLGGNSCLSGDYVGDWYFRKPLTTGDRLTLKDMNHYTTVKTTMFNGIQHPAIVFCDKTGECSYLRRFDYNDYKTRMS